MPTELRKIVFSNSELIDAIEGFARHTKKSMPAGKVVGCRVDGKDRITIALSVHHPAEGSKHTVTFDHASIAAALIRFCMEKKIPMPRTAEKSVERSGDGVALTLKIGGPAPLAQAANE
jgi:hypothetical protein